MELGDTFPPKAEKMPESSGELKKPRKPLSRKHELFARALARGLNQVEAHREAGYPGHAGNASALARSKKISERVQEIMDETTSIEAKARELAVHHIAASKERVLQELSRLALYGETKEEAKLLGPPTWSDKLAALDKLARYYGMFRSQLELAGNLNLNVTDDTSSNIEALISRIARIAARAGANDNPPLPNGATGNGADVGVALLGSPRAASSER